MRNWLTKFWKVNFTYHTRLSPQECIDAICKMPNIFGGNPLNPECYECKKNTETQLLVTFTGAKFGKFVHTQYLVDFYPHDTYTAIVFQFLREKLGILPSTSTYQLDVFMEQKIQAVRVVEAD